MNTKHAQDALQDDDTLASATAHTPGAAARPASRKETRVNDGQIVWGATDRAVYERSVEAEAPSSVFAALDALEKRKAEIIRANHASTFRFGAERELAAIDILITTLKSGDPVLAE